MWYAIVWCFHHSGLMLAAWLVLCALCVLVWWRVMTTVDPL